MHLSEEILERIAYTCKKYYNKGASPQDLVSALAAQFFNVLLEAAHDGEQELVLNAFIDMLVEMKDNIIEEVKILQKQKEDLLQVKP